MRDRRDPLRSAPRTVVRGRGTWSAIVLATMVAACGGSPSPTPSPSAAESTPTPTPSPTPAPTPRYSNEEDAELSALIPAEVSGLAVVQPPITEYGITPGDIGQAAFGELGARFKSLVIGFVRTPRLSLYAMRVDGPVTNAELEPHLATAGRYVGIAGLAREPWELSAVAGREVWVRPSDGATLPGTRVYTWATEDLVFLMIGVDDALNQALLAELPGEPPPSPSPEPSGSGAEGATPAPSVEASGS
jgi:hypothetical protein